MKKIYLMFFFITSSILLADVVTPLDDKSAIVLPIKVRDASVSHDQGYYTHNLKDKDVQLIYTKENLPFAKEVANIEKPLHEEYEKLFGFKLDETLYVGLISSYNQIANGFSTQVPHNKQINYLGGTTNIDYFSSTSWLDTLIYHETAHNYQINPKANNVSKSIHSVFGNGFLMFPWFTIPNINENSFMLEGNAVLNESWHNNGGRLYSGRFKALTLLQAKANKLKPEYLYNRTFKFPYGEIAYIQGGFYNLYMAKKYGLKVINSYFKVHSKYWFRPFSTNRIMKDTVGKTFTETIKEWEEYEKNIAKNLVEVKGDTIAKSQFFTSLSNSKDEIFFITNETGNQAPELVVVNKHNKTITKNRDSYIQGKVIKVHNEYFTQGGVKTSPIRIIQGLIDSDGYIKDGTESKVIQGYLSNSKAVYFDVPKSYSQPQLYVGDKFYTQVNSSVFIDNKDNLYYFKQKGKTRTLYKNKKPLYSYKGFYGIVSDVDSHGNIYFIANSKLGSTLYRYNGVKTQRVSQADNIVEARLINDKEVLLAAMSAKEYYYTIDKMVITNAKPYETKLFFEDKPYYGDNRLKTTAINEIIDLNNSYSSIFDIHYSGTDIFAFFDETDGFTGSLSMNFADPLVKNSANVFIANDADGIVVTGAGYSNSQYLLKYTITGYGVVSKGYEENDKDNIRDSGIIASASLPFLKAGYWNGAFDFNYFQDYAAVDREPLSVTFSISEYKKYGNSLVANQLVSLDFYGVKEREDNIIGGKIEITHDLPAEFYIGFTGKYVKSDVNNNDNNRGVKLAKKTLAGDPSTIKMVNLSDTVYAKDAGYAEIKLSKVINYSEYFFTFPISIQREELYMKYRRYSINDFKDTNTQINETTFGMKFMTIFSNSLLIPLKLEYVHNDANIANEIDKFRFYVDLKL